MPSSSPYLWISEQHKQAPLEVKESKNLWDSASDIVQTARKLRSKDVAALRSLLPKFQDVASALLNLVQDINETKSQQLGSFLRTFLNKTGFLTQKPSTQTLIEKVEALRVATEALIQAFPASGKTETFNNALSLIDKTANVVKPLLKPVLKLLEIKSQVSKVTQTTDVLAMVNELSGAQGVFQFQGEPDVGALSLADQAQCYDGTLIGFFGMYEKVFTYNDLLASSLNMTAVARKLWLAKSAVPQAIALYNNKQEIFKIADTAMSLLSSGEPWDDKSLITWRLDVYRTLHDLMNDPGISSMVHNLTLLLATRLAEKGMQTAGDALVSSIAFVIGPLVSILRFTKYIDTPAALATSMFRVLRGLTNQADPSGKSTAAVQMAELITGGFSLNGWLSMLASGPSILKVAATEIAIKQLNLLIGDKATFCHIILHLAKNTLFNDYEFPQWKNNDPLNSQYPKGLLFNSTKNTATYLGLAMEVAELGNDSYELASGGHTMSLSKEAQAKIKLGYDPQLQKLWDHKGEYAPGAISNFSLRAKAFHQLLERIGAAVNLPHMHLYSQHHISVWQDYIPDIHIVKEWLPAGLLPNELAGEVKEEKDWSIQEAAWTQKEAEAKAAIEGFKTSIEQIESTLKQLNIILPISQLDLGTVYQTHYNQIASLDAKIEKAETAALGSEKAGILFFNEKGSYRENVIKPLLEGLVEKVGDALTTMVTDETSRYLAEFKDKPLTERSTSSFEVGFISTDAKHFLKQMNPNHNPSLKDIDCFDHMTGKFKEHEEVITKQETKLKDILAKNISAAVCECAKIEFGKINSTSANELSNLSESVNVADQEHFEKYIQQIQDLKAKLESAKNVISNYQERIDLIKELELKITSLKEAKSQFRSKFIERVFAAKIRDTKAELHRLECGIEDKLTPESKDAVDIQNAIKQAHSKYKNIKQVLNTYLDNTGLKNFILAQGLIEIVTPGKYIGNTFEFEVQKNKFQQDIRNLIKDLEHSQAERIKYDQNLISKELQTLIASFMDEVSASLKGDNTIIHDQYEKWQDQCDKEHRNYLLKRLFPSYVPQKVNWFFASVDTSVTKNYTKQIDEFEKDLASISAILNNPFSDTMIAKLKELPQIKLRMGRVETEHKVESDIQFVLKQKSEVIFMLPTTDEVFGPLETPAHNLGSAVSALPVLEENTALSNTDEEPEYEVANTKNSPRSEPSPVTISPPADRISVSSNEAIPLARGEAEVDTETDEEEGINISSPRQYHEPEVFSQVPRRTSTELLKIPSEPEQQEVKSLASPRVNYFPFDDEVQADDLEDKAWEYSKKSDDGKAVEEEEKTIAISVPTFKINDVRSRLKELKDLEITPFKLQRARRQVLDQAWYELSELERLAELEWFKLEKPDFDVLRADKIQTILETNSAFYNKFISLYNSIDLSYKVIESLESLRKLDSYRSGTPEATAATEAISALDTHIDTECLGRPGSYSKLLIGALISLVGIAIIVLSCYGIPFDGGLNASGMMTLGGFVTMGGGFTMFKGTQGDFPSKLSHLKYLAEETEEGLTADLLPIIGSPSK